MSNHYRFYEGIKDDYVSYDHWQQQNTLASTNKETVYKEYKLLMECINTQLTHKQRQCLLMKVVDQMPQQEIAWRLGVAESTVSRHIKAARKKLGKYTDIIMLATKLN